MIMFQRKARMKQAAIGDERIHALGLVKFLKTAKEDFQRRGKEDEAFVLEMLEDHFRQNQTLEYSPRIFGL